MRLVAEFTTEPFQGEGEVPPEHALAALEAAERAGLTCDFGPLGTEVRGDLDEVLPALAEVLRAALAAGATRVTVQAVPSEEPVAGADPEPVDG